MKEQLVIHLADDEATTCWAIVNERGEVSGAVACGDLSQAAALADGRQVRVLVPGTDVLLTAVDLPVRQTRQLLQAVPYALEESLAEDPEKLHFAVHPHRQEQGYPVAVVSRECMDDWLQRLQDAGIKAHSLETEVLAVQPGEQDWGLVRLDGRSLLRTGDYSGLACEHALFPELLNVLLGARDATAAVQIGCRDYSGAVATDAWTGHAAINIHSLAGGGPADGVTALAGGCGRVPALNLLQGAYDRRDSLWQVWRPWLPALVLMVLWAALQIGYGLWEKNRLDIRLEAADTEINRLVMSSFPGTRNIPKGKEKNFFIDELAALGSSGDLDDGFLGLLAAVGNTIQQFKEVSIQGLSYRQETLQLSLDISDLQVLDQLKQQLSGQTGKQVDIQGATAQEGRVRARLRIRGMSP